jgi:hypothetical protein
MQILVNARNFRWRKSSPFVLRRLPHTILNSAANEVVEIECKRVRAQHERNNAKNSEALRHPTSSNGGHIPAQVPKPQKLSLYIDIDQPASRPLMICTASRCVVLRLESGDKAMEIENTKFGNITIDGKTYEHDVVIRLSGEVVKRKKKLSKKYYGTSHVMSKDEAKFVFEKGCEQFIVGSGQMGNVHLSPEVSRKRVAGFCCSRPPRRSMCSTSHMQRRSGFFT